MKRSEPTLWRLWVLGLLAGLAFGLPARAEMTLKVADQAPPKELAAPFRDLLQPQAVQLRDEDAPVFEFWFRKDIPLASVPAAPKDGLAAVSETTYLGAAAVHKELRDYREDEIVPGLYTIRMGLRPDDGNHLGTSDYKFFAVLIPVRLDPDLAGLETYKKLTNASRKETSSDHPVILSLRPATTDQGEFPRLEEPAPDHKSVLLKLSAQANNQSVPLLFHVVYEGVAIH